MDSGKWIAAKAVLAGADHAESRNLYNDV